MQPKHQSDMSKPVTADAKGIVLGKDEELKLVLHPHPLALWKYDALAGVYLVSAGLLVLIFQFLGTNVPVSFAIPYLQLSVWWAFLIIPSLIAGLLWVTKQPLIYSGLVAVVGTVVREPDPDGAARATGYRGDGPTRLRLGGSARYPIEIRELGAAPGGADDAEI